MTRPSAFDPNAPLGSGIKLIEASAGTGKTFTITTLVLKLLMEEGLSITEVLVVTFTEAATAELRDRVRSRLRAALLAYQGTQPQGDDWLQAYVTERQAAGHEAADVASLQAALTEFDQATISTIHGFCRRMLQENAFESGVRFDAQLVTSVSDMLDDVAADAWTARMSGLSEDVYRYLTARKTGAPHLTVSPDSMQDLSRRATSDRDIRVLPSAVSEMGQVDTADFQAAVAAVSDCWASEGRDARQVIELAVEAGLFKKSLTDVYEKSFGELNAWRQDPPQAPTFSMQSTPALQLSASALAEHKKKSRKAPVPEHELFRLLDEIHELLKDHTRYLATQAVTLNVELIHQAREQLDARKQALGLQSFDDLLVHLSLALHHEQTGPRLARAIRGRYRAALIDEFQDTSPVQFSIFSRVFMDPDAAEDAEPYLFLIGDPKQAIYSFRAADVYAYLRAAAAVGSDDNVTLDANWRSDDGLIRALGHLYHSERLPDPFADERIAFVPVESRNPDRLASSGAPLAPFRIRLATTPAKTPKKGPRRYDKGELGDLMATCVPDDVARLLDQGLTIEGKDLQPGDIAILVRTNKQALTLQGELRDRQIPSVLHGTASVFNTAEATDLRLVLHAVLEPRRVSAVRSALASDLLGVGAAELAQLVEAPQGGPLAGAMGWDQRLESFHSLRSVWEERGFVQMFRQLLNDYTIQDRVLSRVGGERSMTNLLHLAELLHRTASQDQLGPEGLYRWLEQQLADDDQAADPVQLRLESDHQALQLITIHKSKGLEFPVVLCPYLWDGNLLRESDKTYIRFHDPDHDERLTLDVGSDYQKLSGADVSWDDDGAPPGRARSEELAQHECQAENARLLYVALTRARHHCTVYFAQVKEGETSPVGHLLLGGQEPDSLDEDPAQRSRDRLALTEAHIATMEPEEVLDAMEDLVDDAPEGLIGLEVIDDTPAPAYTPEREQEIDLAPRELSLALDWNWRTTSYSGLLSSQPHAALPQTELDGVDRDAVVEEADALPTPKESSEQIPLHAFPKGARCGNCLHKILELTDFATLSETDGLDMVRTQLTAYGFKAKTWADSLRGALTGALATQLDENDEALRLDAISRDQRLDELGFVFPVAGGLSREGEHVTPARLAAVFAKYASDPVPSDYAARLETLAFRPLQGFLGGFIDLTFEWQGRYYLADYKSNFLGATFGAYAHEHMQRAMAEHHYFLQYHLYSVALHRYLRWRVKDYSYEDHFGGVYYLFLRGMSAATGPSFGVFRDRPDQDLIEALDALLGGVPCPS